MPRGSPRRSTLATLSSRAVPTAFAEEFPSSLSVAGLVADEHRPAALQLGAGQRDGRADAFLCRRRGGEVVVGVGEPAERGREQAQVVRHRSLSDGKLRRGSCRISAVRPGPRDLPRRQRPGPSAPSPRCIDWRRLR